LKLFHKELCKFSVTVGEVGHLVDTGLEIHGHLSVYLYFKRAIIFCHTGDTLEDLFRALQITINFIHVFLFDTVDLLGDQLRKLEDRQLPSRLQHI
jgi:hypothetical protein